MTEQLEKMNQIEEALENLKLVLTSPRKRAPGTLNDYLYKAGIFLTWLSQMHHGNIPLFIRTPPDDMDLRRYFAYRRERGIKEGTLRTEFSVLKKLFMANKWPWPFGPEDRPDLPEEISQPAFTQEEVVTLIRNRSEYSDGETFYLAIATTYGPRREELARIASRDLKDAIITIHTAKKGPKRRHLIPEQIAPILAAYKPKPRNVSTLSHIFWRICDESGMGRKKGYGWHSIRRTLETLLLEALARDRQPLTFVADYMRWSRKSMGTRFLGSATAGIYTHPEILSDDPFHVDRVIDRVHPFLPYWREASV